MRVKARVDEFLRSKEMEMMSDHGKDGVRAMMQGAGWFSSSSPVSL